MSVCAPESDLLKAVPHGRLTIRKADRVSACVSQMAQPMTGVHQTRTYGNETAANPAAPAAPATPSKAMRLLMFMALSPSR